MSLNSILVRKLHVKRWQHESPEETYTVEVTRGGKPVAGVRFDRISVVEEEVLHLRDAWHIHEWFMSNVQGAREDGNQHLVPDFTIHELYQVCQEVITSSRLVPGEVFKRAVLNFWNPKGSVQRTAGRVIEDSTVARRLLPISGGPNRYPYLDYDERYLSSVRKTRDWAMRMLSDRKAGVPGEIYYSLLW